MAIRVLFGRRFPIIPQVGGECRQGVSGYIMAAVEITALPERPTAIALADYCCNNPHVLPDNGVTGLPTRSDLRRAFRQRQ